MPKWAIYALICAALTAAHRPLIQWIKQWTKEQKDQKSDQPVARQLDNFVLISATFSGIVLGVTMVIMFAIYGVPNVGITFWLWIVLAGLIQFVGLTQATAAFANGDLSQLVLLNALLPVVQTVLGWLLRREWLSAWQLAGISVVAIGMLLRPRDPASEPEAQVDRTTDDLPAGSLLVRMYRWTQASAKRQYAIALTTWPLYAFALKPALASVRPRTPAMPFVGSSMVMATMAVLGAIQCLYVQRRLERKSGTAQSLMQTAKMAARLAWRDVANATSLALFTVGAVIVGAQQFCDLMAYAAGKVAAVASMMEASIVFNIPMMLIFPKLEQLLRRFLGSRWTVELISESGRMTPRSGAAAVIVMAGAMMIGGFGK